MFFMSRIEKVVFHSESDVTIHLTTLMSGAEGRQKVLKGCVLTGPGSWSEREGPEGPEGPEGAG